METKGRTRTEAVRSFMYVALIVLLFTSTTACTQGRTNRHSSSIVEYLYTHYEHGENSVAPRLSFPLRVGIAFVPQSNAGPNAGHLGEKEMIELVDRISAEFKGHSFIKNVEVIPSAYLTRNGGFSNLDRIRSVHGVDVIALLSYDQVQHTDQGTLSLLYWTVVGAYLIKGEKNDTSTLIDAALYDIPSRHMLFRVPGTSSIKGLATPVNLSEQQRTDSVEGFRAAANSLILRLHDELERFKTKAEEKPPA